MDIIIESIESLSYDIKHYKKSLNIISKRNDKDEEYMIIGYKKIIKMCNNKIENI